MIFINIKNILNKFEHHGKYYILFKLMQDNQDYLYFLDPKNNNRALLFGKNLYPAISKYLNKEDINCIECMLGSLIRGGFSFDNGDYAYSKLSIKEANEILTGLKEYLNEENNSIILF